jgi:hypothetical protein
MSKRFKKLSLPGNPLYFAFVDDEVLILNSGLGHYDIKEAFLLKELEGLEELVGVRGGHIGWSLKSEGNKEYDFGRKYYEMMELVKKLIDDGTLKIKYTCKTNQEQRGY